MADIEALERRIEELARRIADLERRHAEAAAPPVVRPTPPSGTSNYDPYTQGVGPRVDDSNESAPG